MLSGDIAKHQIQDRIRAAEQDRLARSARVDRGRTHPAVIRRGGSGLLAAIVGRRRKATPATAGVRLA